MRLIIMDMQNRMLAKGMSMTLEDSDCDFRVQHSDNPKNTATLCREKQPYALLMEATPYSGWRLEERMKLTDEVRQTNPDCKIVLMCDENTDKRLADDVRQTKKDGLIDQFIYGSISSTYLAAVMDAL